MGVEQPLKATNKIKPRLETHYEKIEEYIRLAKEVEGWVNTLPDLIQGDDLLGYNLSNVYEGLNDNKPIGNKEENFIKLFKDKHLYEQFDKKCKVLCGYIWDGYKHLTLAEQWLYHEQPSRPMEEKLGSSYVHSYYAPVHKNLEFYVLDIRTTLERTEKEGMEYFRNAVERLNIDAS